MIDVSFSDRFTNVSKIADSLLRKESKDRADAQALAQDIENGFHASATSVDDYNTKLSEYLASGGIDDNDDTLPDTQDEDETIDDLQPTLSPAAITLGRYEGCQHYRDGISSTVYRARNPDANTSTDTSTAKPAYIALKLTTPSSQPAPHDSEREARILSGIHSPHIIPLLDTLRLPGGHLVLAFPFMPLDLSTALSTRRLSRAAARSIAHDMLSGLAALHAAQILHRDIKPSNILLASPTGPALLADLGTAWSPADPASEPAAAKVTDIGTTSYRAPELLFGARAYGAPLDMWSVGCVLAELASQQRTPLFESGPLGSELALIRSMFATLGTPDARSWPEAAALPDWGKFAWRVYAPRAWAEVLPGASAAARDLVARLVRFESGERLSAVEALRHSYFVGVERARTADAAWSA